MREIGHSGSGSQEDKEELIHHGSSKQLFHFYFSYNNVIEFKQLKSEIHIYKLILVFNISSLDQSWGPAKSNI